MQIFVNTDYKFVKRRWIGIAASVLFVIGGVVAYMQHGINFGIDFSGGASIILKFKDTVPLAQLRREFKDATIQQYGKPEEHQILIRLPEQHRESDYAGQAVFQLYQHLNPEAATKHDLNYYGTERLADLLKQTDPDNRGTNPSAQEYYETLAHRIIEKRSEVGIFTDMGQVTGVEGVTSPAAKVINERCFLGRFNVLNQETVGPQVGTELQKKALWAVILSSLAMGIYIWLRFDFTFGMGAVACIVHDVSISIAFMLMMNLEFSLNVVAALLTIVGYSINDTVVMYDRVRENKRKIKTPMSPGDHLDLGINNTLSRTALTSGSTLLVLVALLIFGGNVIRGFAWILLMGVISGTYSTLFIVPAVALIFDRSKPRRLAPARAAAAADNNNSAKKRRVG
jgi:preprotein translocase subunit SecF